MILDTSLSPGAIVSINWLVKYLLNFSDERHVGIASVICVVVVVVDLTVSWGYQQRS